MTQRYPPVRLYANSMEARMPRLGVASLLLVKVGTSVSVTIRKIGPTKSFHGTDLLDIVSYA